MFNTFIIIAGIATLLLAGGLYNRLAEIVKHLQCITEKTVGVTLELHQLHSDLNRTTAQSVASVSAASAAVKTPAPLLKTSTAPFCQPCRTAPRCSTPSTRPCRNRSRKKSRKPSRPKPKSPTLWHKAKPWPKQ